MKNNPNTLCKNSEHHFVELKHFTGGSECHCCKCGLKVSFNCGWPERIEPKEMEAFLSKYKGRILIFDDIQSRFSSENLLFAIIRHCVFLAIYKSMRYHGHKS